MLLALLGEAAMRSQSSLPVQVEANVSRAVQGGPLAKSKPRATTAVPGKLPRPTAISKPRALYLTKAHSAVFDVRKLHGTVVRRERPERPAPGEAADGADESVPSSVSPKAIATAAASAQTPGTDIDFDGLDFASWGAGHPPDTNGDVGPTYYIQTVNTSIGIYDKSNGNRVAAFTFNAFMSQGNFGNLCDTDNFGDPVVLYDTFDDRWFVTDFAFKLDGSGNVNPQHVFQCFAVSKTGDPVNGGWNFYSIESPGGLGDYPKFGVWPDGIYMSANMFGYAASGSYFGFHVWALNKEQMYDGAPSPQVVDFAGPSSDFTLLPANARLQAGTPPAGSSEYFVSTEQFLNALSIYKLHVDWDKISTSTFTGPTAQLAPTCWPNATPVNASTTANKADVLPIRAMAQAQYTNLAGAESVWVTHTVERGESANNTTCNAPTGGNATVRWYQANVTGGTVAANVVQGKTYDPDGANTFFRFMPALAVDRLGDMAVGYSKSNSTTDPQIKYSGRLAGDPVNTLPQTEQTLIDGTGSQSGNCGSSACTRWGDYSGMSLDPNGCEFWETNEYYATTGLNDLTRIGAFHFPGCTTVGNGTLSGTVTDGTNPISGASVALGSRTTTTDGSGHYSFSVPAGTYASLSASKDGFDTGSSSSVTVPDGGTVTRNFALNASAQSGCFTDNSQSTFQRGVPTNCDLVASPGNVVLVNQTVVDQRNEDLSNFGVGLTTTTWGGQTFTPAVSGSLTKAEINMFCSSCTGTTPNLTLSVRATSGGLPTGADLATATIPGFSSGAASYYTATFGSPVNVSAGTQYALVIRPTADPSPGIYALTRSSSNVYTGGARVSSTDSGGTWTAQTTDIGFRVSVRTGFPPSGSFVSSLKDANPAAGRSATWTTLSFTATKPAGTDVKFQVAGSNSASGPFAFVGPDGTAGTFFTTSGASLTQFNGFRYLRYKAILSTSDSTVTPSLSSVTVCYDDVTGATATSLAVSPATGTYGGTTNLSATLTAGPDGVNGKTVAFTLNGTSVGTATTNANGVATKNNVSLAAIDAGSYPSGVSASFAGEGIYVSSNGSASLTVGKADQAISVTKNAPASAAYNDSFDVAASGGGSGNPVTFSSAGSCSNTGATFTITSGTGTCTVKYDQAGNGNYNAAPQVTESVTAQKAGQVITITTPAPPSAVYGNSFGVAAVGGGSGNPVTFSSGGSCSNSGGTFTMTSGSGTCTVKYDEAGDANYAAAPQKTESVTAQKAGQTITITTHAPASAAYNQSFGVAATGGGSGNPVTFSGGGACTNSGATFTMTSSSGTCTVKYDEAGNGNYAAAPQKTESVDARNASQTITVTTHAPASAHYHASFSVAATGGGSGNLVTFSSSGACSNVGPTFTMTDGAGTCTVKYDQAGDANYADAPEVTESVTAQKASQSIAFDPVAPKQYGDGDFALNASASSGLPVSFGATGQCTASGNTVHVTGAGSCTITASQTGDSNYDAAAVVPRTFSIDKAVLMVDPSPSTSTRQYSDPNPSFSPHITGFVNGENESALTTQPVCSPIAGRSAAPGNYGVLCSGGEAGNYSFSYTGGTLTVTQEDARTAYSGKRIFKTPSASSAKATPSLSATIRDITAVTGDPAFDSFPGDISSARVTFVNRATHAAFAGCSNLPVALGVPADPTVGRVSCNTILAGSAGKGKPYTVGIVVSGFYARDSSAENATIRVVRPPKGPKLVVLCYRHHTIKVKASAAKRLLKHGAKRGACKKPRR